MNIYTKTKSHAINQKYKNYTELFYLLQETKLEENTAYSILNYSVRYEKYICNYAQRNQISVILAAQETPTYV